MQFCLPSSNLSYEHNLAVVSVSKSKCVLVRREYSVRIITKSTERFVSQKPCEEWILITKCIGDRMCSNDTRALGEVLALFDRVGRSNLVDVWEFAGVDV